MNKGRCPHGLQTTELIWLADEIVTQEKIIGYATRAKDRAIVRLIDHYELEPNEFAKLIEAATKRNIR